MRGTHVIVGAGAAGLAAVRAIRRRDRESRIVVVTAEEGPSYSPALLPYLLGGKVDEAGLVLADRGFFAAHGVEVFPGVRAVGVDHEERVVRVEAAPGAGAPPPRGGTIPYSTLLIATGASARGEEVPGAGPGGPGGPDDEPLTLRTLDDARRLRRRLGAASSVAVLGAGLAGLEIAWAARTLGKSVTVVARSASVLSQTASPREAAVVQAWLEEAGVVVLLSRRPLAVEETGGGRRYLTTREGDAVPADLLIAAKGAVPETAWAERAAATRGAPAGPGGVGAPGATEADLPAGRAIAVDLRMRAGPPDVYAAGDVVRARHAVTGRLEAITSWPSACAQGAVAGANMAGGDVELAGEVPFNVLPVGGRRAAFIGCTTEAALTEFGDDLERSERGRPASGRGRTLWSVDGVVVGAAVFGPCANLGVLRRFIEAGTPVGSAGAGGTMAARAFRVAGTAGRFRGSAATAGPSAGEVRPA